MSRRSQEVDIYFANEGSVLAFFSADLGHSFLSNFGNEFGVMFSGKGRYKPQFAYNLFRIHSFAVYTDLIEYNIVSDAKASLLRVSFSISTLTAGDTITNGVYKN